MTDPIDELIRSASSSSQQVKRRPARTGLALLVLIGLAAILLGLPILLVVTGLSEDVLLGIAIGDLSIIGYGEN